MSTPAEVMQAPVQQAETSKQVKRPSMGLSSVAVLHHDMHDQFAPNIRRAMREVNGANQNVDFGCGRIVSWDHANGYQVVVVHGNGGWRIGSDESPPPPDYLRAVAAALRAHGYRVTAPKT